MAVEELPELVTVVLLACVLGVFLYWLATPRRKREDRVRDFGTAFSVFIAGWVAAEILAIALPPEWSGASDVLHLGVALGFAIWINVRWRWSLRLARVSP
ncbi:MAG: hypothetical protein A3K65_05810 [Euryarchaeota archaeon RBG_16_68_12]|nr:MAG: hypothetical protein A3K65_05810 [Euryarchaeota archaeon RBG_16_68_12]